MAYDQYSNYPQQQRPAFNNQPPPRGQSRGAPPPRGPDPYAYPQAGYGQDRYQQQNARVDSYAGYDGEDILDQYGGDEQDQPGYNQQYPQAGSGYGGQNEPRGQPSRPVPQQYREPPQRRDNYGPPQQGNGNVMNGQMGGQGGRGRGGPPPRNYPPPRGYPPQQGYGPPQRSYTSPQAAPQGYDDRQQYPQYDDQTQYQGQQGISPPSQKRKLKIVLYVNVLNTSSQGPFDQLAKLAENYAFR
jgi:hypothetical protein